MKPLKLLSLAIVVVIFSCAMFACKPAAETIVQVKIVKHDGEVMMDLPDVAVQGDEPTVLDALNAACLKLNYIVEMSTDGKTVLRIDGYGEAVAETAAEPETDEAGNPVPTEAPAADPLANYYWQYTINGAEPDKNSGNLTTKIISADDKIEFKFVEFVMSDTTK